jgi:hypothetical protein
MKPIRIIILSIILGSSGIIIGFVFLILFWEFETTKSIYKYYSNIEINNLMFSVKENESNLLEGRDVITEFIVSSKLSEGIDTFFQIDIGRGKDVSVPIFTTSGFSTERITPGKSVHVKRLVPTKFFTPSTANEMYFRIDIVSLDICPSLSPKCTSEGTIISYKGRLSERISVN